MLDHLDQPRVLVSADRCTLAYIWPDGPITVATRDDPDATWGPPVTVEEES
jgi:hypothetical protein